MKDDFPMVCRTTQCLFCLGDERLLYQHRVFEYAKPNRMMNEVEKHLKKYAPRMRSRVRIRSARQRDWSCPA